MKNRKTKPYIKSEEQENKSPCKKGRTGKQNPMRKSGHKKRKKKKKKNTVPCLSELLNAIHNNNNNNNSNNKDIDGTEDDLTE